MNDKKGENNALILLSVDIMMIPTSENEVSLVIMEYLVKRIKSTD